MSGKNRKLKKRRKQRFQRRAEQQRGAGVEEVEGNIPRKCTYGKGADVWTSSEGSLVNQKRSLMQTTHTHAETLISTECFRADGDLLSLEVPCRRLGSATLARLNPTEMAGSH